MLVLHTSALDGQLLLWGETPSATEKPRRRKTSRAAPSPFAPGLVVGRALAYWSQALRFAGALVARQHFLPGLHQGDGGWRAAWQPVPLGPETATLGQLARSMPHACRAFSTSAEAPPEVS